MEDASAEERFNKARDLIVTLIKLSETDGEVEEREIQYILSVGLNVGLDEKQIIEIIKNRGSIIVDYPNSEVERLSLLYYLLFLMKIDQKLSKGEINTIYKVGFKLGFRESMLRDLISVIQVNLEKKVPASALIEKVKRYLN